jgi:hypothetical protein
MKIFKRLDNTPIQVVDCLDGRVFIDPPSFRLDISRHFCVWEDYNIPNVQRCKKCGLVKYDL